MSARRRLFLGLAISAATVVGLAVVAELALRGMGHRPRNRPSGDPTYVIQPREFMLFDTPAGYRYAPGEFVATYQTGLVVPVHHDEDGLRRTRPAPTPPASGEVQAASDVVDSVGPGDIWVFGGSFTHGWSVRDEEAFAWLVQQNLPDTRVRNFAVGGYGTLNCWLRFLEALDTFAPPSTVIVTYGAFHDKRNTWTRNWSRSIAPKRPEKAHELPYARLRGDGGFDVVYEVPNYRAFPMVHQLALSNWLEAKVGLFENRVLHRSHEVSQAILLAFQQRCDQEGIALVVAGILDDPVTRDMLQRCDSAGIDTVDISVDLTAEGFRNLPHDAHPSALAHRSYADKLLTYLKRTDG